MATRVGIGLTTTKQLWVSCLKGTAKKFKHHARWHVQWSRVQNPVRGSSVFFFHCLPSDYALPCLAFLCIPLHTHVHVQDLIMYSVHVHVHAHVAAI